MFLSHCAINSSIYRCPFCLVLSLWYSHLLALNPESLKTRGPSWRLPWSGKILSQHFGATVLFQNAIQWLCYEWCRQNVGRLPNHYALLVDVFASPGLCCTTRGRADVPPRDYLRLCLWKPGSSQAHALQGKAEFCDQEYFFMKKTVG